MKIAQLLREMSEIEFQFDMMERLLKKEGFSPKKTSNTRSLVFDVNRDKLEALSVHVFPISYSDDHIVWFLDFYYESGGKIAHVPELSFDEVVPNIRRVLKGCRVTESIELLEMSEQEFQIDMVGRLLKKSGFDPKWRNHGECLQFAVDATYTVNLIPGTSKDDEITWLIELIGGYGAVERIRHLSFDEVVPSALALLKKFGLKEGVEYDPAFKMLDGTNPSKPYTQAEIMAAMKQLNARIERQAEDYGNKIDRKTGKFKKTHKFHDAQIAADE